MNDVKGERSSGTVLFSWIKKYPETREEETITPPGFS
jgi:hypothetical protein